MEKESTLTKFFQTLLKELSKNLIQTLLSFSSLATLLLLLKGLLSNQLKEIFQKPIMQWTAQSIIFLSCLFISYSLFLKIISVKHYKKLERNKEFFLFEYNNYQWKMSIPLKKLSNIIPNCPKHGVLLSINDNVNNTRKCPFCNISIPNDYVGVNFSLAQQALNVGIAMYDGHYKK